MPHFSEPQGEVIFEVVVKLFVVLLTGELAVGAAAVFDSQREQVLAQPYGALYLYLQVDVLHANVRRACIWTE